MNRKLYDRWQNRDNKGEKADEQSQLNENIEKSQQQYSYDLKMNLIGYMLSKMSWHSENLVDIMLNKMMLELKQEKD